MMRGTFCEQRKGEGSSHLCYYPLGVLRLQQTIIKIKRGFHLFDRGAKTTNESVQVIGVKPSEPSTMEAHLQKTVVK
jgi:hypothetical protein